MAARRNCPLSTCGKKRPCRGTARHRSFLLHTKTGQSGCRDAVFPKTSLNDEAASQLFTRADSRCPFCLRRTWETCCSPVSSSLSLRRLRLSSALSPDPVSFQSHLVTFHVLRFSFDSRFTNHHSQLAAPPVKYPFLPQTPYSRRKPNITGRRSRASRH